MPDPQLGRVGGISSLHDEFMEYRSKCLPLLAIACSAFLAGCSLLGGLVSAALPFAGAKLMFSCIPAGTRIDTPTGSRPIELLETGDSVVGYNGKPVRVLQKHSYMEDPSTVFRRIRFADGASVALCGMHRVAGVRAMKISVGQSIAGREVVEIEDRSGETRSFDLLTEDAGYQIDRVPVNSMIEEMTAAAASRTRCIRP